MAIIVSRLPFQGLWEFLSSRLASAFKTVPLTTDYTHFFNRRNALKNLLFIKINRILTVVWALSFLVEGGMALWIGTTSMEHFAAIT